MRILADIIVILSVFFTPWYVPVAMALILMFFFNYIEIIIVGAMLDALYGGYIFIWSAFFAFVIIVLLKSRLAFYS